MKHYTQVIWVRIIPVTLSAKHIVLGLAFLASPALADGELAGKGEPLKIIKIDRDTCRQIAPYLSAGEADYKPGIAADGSAVAPADLDGAEPYKARDYYQFPVEIFPFAGGPATPFSDATKLEVANVTLDVKTGRVTIDGQDVSGGNRALTEACANEAGAHLP